MKGSVATAALLGLVTFPVASGQSLRHDQTANGITDGEGSAAAQRMVAFDGSTQRRVHYPDDANDLYDSVSAETLSVCMQADTPGGQKAVGGVSRSLPLIPRCWYLCRCLCLMFVSRCPGASCLVAHSRKKERPTRVATGESGDRLSSGRRNQTTTSPMEICLPPLRSTRRFHTTSLDR